jgi:hypothetical protein
MMGSHQLLARGVPLARKKSDEATVTQGVMGNNKIKLTLLAALNK